MVYTTYILYYFTMDVEKGTTHVVTKTTTEDPIITISTAVKCPSPPPAIATTSNAKGKKKAEEEQQQQPQPQLRLRHGAAGVLLPVAELSTVSIK